MNIGLFTETYYPEVNGVANSVYMLKTQLEQRGQNVYVFTTTSPGAPKHEHNVFRVPSLPCFLITERRVGLFYQPKLAHVIKKLNLDLIHTHTEFSLGMFGRIMAKELKLPLVHTYHTIYEDYTHYVTKFKLFDERAKSFVRVFSKICCNTVEQVIVPTEKVRELLVNYDVWQDIEVIPTGVNLKKFDKNNFKPEEKERLRASYGIFPEDKVILYLGRISKEKNIEELLAAMEIYLLKRKNVRFVLVGGGPEKEYLQQYAKKLSVSNEILFIGEQPWDRIALFYQMGDVFVSASNSETQGLTYIEAMASGLPVIAKEDPCLDEILENGFNGYTFKEQTEFIKELDEVLFSENKIAYGENSMQKVRKYSIEGFAERIEAVYEKLTDRMQSGKVRIGGFTI